MMATYQYCRGGQRETEGGREGQRGTEGERREKKDILA
jgi:hypothetical protein